MKFTLLLVKTLFSKTPLGKYGGGMFYSFLRRGMGLYGVRYYVGRVYLLSRILPIRALGMLRML